MERQYSASTRSFESPKNQLGHTDGGALVQRLYGHPSERLARERIKRATAGKPYAVVSLPDVKRGPSR